MFLIVVFLMKKGVYTIAHFFISNPIFGRPRLRFSKIIATFLATAEPQIENPSQLYSVLSNFVYLSL